MTTLPHIVGANFHMSPFRPQRGWNLTHRLAFRRRQEVCLSSCRCSLGSAKGCWLAVQTIASPITTSLSYCLQTGASLISVDALVPWSGCRLCLLSIAQMLIFAIGRTHVPPFPRLFMNLYTADCCSSGISLCWSVCQRAQLWLYSQIQILFGYLYLWAHCIYKLHQNHLAEALLSFCWAITDAYSKTGSLCFMLPPGLSPRQRQCASLHDTSLLAAFPCCKHFIAVTLPGCRPFLCRRHGRLSECVQEA